MRLFTAELLKMRRRWATYVVLGVLIGLMALVFVLTSTLGGAVEGGDPGNSPSSLVTFPTAYAILNQFVFGLGSLLAVAYAASIAGADFTWGVFGVIVARGESRSGYMLVKAIAVAAVICLGVVIAFAAGIVLAIVSAGLAHTSAGDPFSADGIQSLVRSIGLGIPVILERAAIGFAVAVVLRSQVAGIVAGIVLQIGEGILSAVVFATSFASRIRGGALPEAVGPEWFQFLPFTIGDSVLAEAPGVTQSAQGLLLRPVPSTLALVVTGVYLVVAMVIVLVTVERAEVTN